MDEMGMLTEKQGERKEECFYRDWVGKNPEGRLPVDWVKEVVSASEGLTGKWNRTRRGNEQDERGR
jgi:hypothetical protein